MKELVKNKGITLIALVITIILLLILGGVALNLVAGGDGIIEKAVLAVNANRVAVIEEQINLWKIQNEYGGYLELNLNESLENFAEKLVNEGLISSKEKEEIISTGKLSLGNNEVVLVEGTYIYTKEEFEAFRDSVNNGKTYENEYVFLMNDIDMCGDENDESTWWIPIGSCSDNIVFKGIFEGNNFSINNLYGEYITGDAEIISLFSFVSDATIKDLTVHGNIIIKNGSSEQDNLAAAGIVGLAKGQCYLLNLNNKVNIEKRYTGRECAGVLGCGGNAESYNNKIKLYNCRNEANVSGGNNTAGIVGCIYNCDIIIDKCYNKGDIYCLLRVGGIIGRDGGNSNIIIQDSYNEGKISGCVYAGGIMGRAGCEGTSLSVELFIKNCYNIGRIESLVGSTGARYFGGIIGRTGINLTELKLMNCYNDSKLERYNR